MSPVAGVALFVHNAIIRAMKTQLQHISQHAVQRAQHSVRRTARQAVSIERIKPAEGVFIVLLSLGTLLVFLWAVFAAVRLVLG